MVERKLAGGVDGVGRKLMTFLSALYSKEKECSVHLQIATSHAPFEPSS